MRRVGRQSLVAMTAKMPEGKSYYLGCSYFGKGLWISSPTYLLTNTSEIAELQVFTTPGCKRLQLRRRTRV